MREKPGSEVNGMSEISETHHRRINQRTSQEEEEGRRDVSGERIELELVREGRVDIRSYTETRRFEDTVLSRLIYQTPICILDVT